MVSRVEVELRARVQQENSKGLVAPSPSFKPVKLLCYTYGAVDCTSLVVLREGESGGLIDSKS